MFRKCTVKILINTVTNQDIKYAVKTSGEGKASFNTRIVEHNPMQKEIKLFYETLIEKRKRH
jgi:hypothetical protein